MTTTRDGIKTRRLADGSLHYLAEVYLGRGADGKRREASKAFRTRKQAREWKRQQLVARDAGTFVKPSAETLGTYLGRWLAGAVEASDVGTSTRQTYRRKVKRWVLPAPIATKPLAGLCAADLEAYYLTLRDVGIAGGHPLSATSIAYVHRLLKAALKRAVRDRLIARNPADEAELPGKCAAPVGVMLEPGEDEHVMHILSRPEMDHLLATAAKPVAEVRVPKSKHDAYRSPLPHDRYLALYHVLAHGGLRPSEALALTRDDVLATGVRITKALVTGITGETWRIEEPKTEKSKRVVSLPAETMTVLRQHLAEQEAERAAAGARYTDHGFLFASQTGAPLNLRNLTRRSFKRLLASAKLPEIRLYDLRHSHISAMLAAGVPVHVVSARAGHAAVTMTLNVYAHAVPADHTDALALYAAAGATAAPTLTLVADAA